MKHIFYAGLCMAALATSCSNDMSFDGTHTVQLDATVTAEKSRAAFKSDGSFYWQSGDQIGVLTVGNENAVSKDFSPFTLKSGEKTASATFEGNISGAVGSYAIYPYDKAQTLENNTLSYTFPSEYTYTKVDQEIFLSSQDGNSFRPAMLASITNNSMAFKHLGAIFCIEVESMPCTEGDLTLTTNQKLCGQFTTSVNVTTPELKTESTTVSENNAVTIHFSNATQGSKGIFYVPVPTCVYTDAKVKITPKSGTAIEVYAGQYTMERTDLYKLAVKKATVEATTETTASSTEEVATKLGESDNVALTSEVSGTTTINVPAVSTTTAKKTVTLQKVANNANITISDNNATATESTNSVQNLTVSVPNNSESAPTLTVNMPKSTVTLAGNAGMATFKKVTATTAENTLVVSDGVTIDELVIEKGNVRINKGATVKSITLASGNTTSKVFYEDGATLPTSMSITPLQIIETADQLSAARYKAGNYALMNDLTATTQVGAYGVNVSLDLNGKTLTTSNLIYSYNKGTLTLKNGNIMQSGSNTNIQVYSDCTLNVDGVTYTGTSNTYNCIFVVNNAQNATINVKNSTINGGYYAISTNASTNPVATCKLTLENSTFAAEETGALLNIPGTFTITNCKFSGNHHGALLRGGTYTISGCEFTLNASIKPEDTTENNWLTAWGIGNKCAFAALTVGNYKNTSYQYLTNITFKEVESNKKNTATVSGDNASSYPAMHVCANTDTDKGVTITGLSNITLSQTKTTPNNGPEYGTGNITVDNEKIENANIPMTNN